MSTILHKPFSLSWRGKPPHMLAPDIPVWYRFLDRGSPFFYALHYDCLLGAPDLTPEEKQDPLKKMQQFNASKRADAIGITATHVWIIEVSADPGLRAIGQLQVYRTLWLRDPVIDLMEKMVLVAERIDPHILDAATQYGITVFIV